MSECPLYGKSCNVKDLRLKQPLSAKGICETDYYKTSCEKFTDWKSEEVRKIIQNGQGQQGVLNFLNSLEGVVQ
jgi:hypothetical protein